jgi:cyanophycin synthetase
MTDASPAALLSVRSSQFILGYAHGMKSPALAVHLAAPPQDSLWAALQTATAKWTDVEHLDINLTNKAIAETVFANPLAQWVLSAAIWAQSLAGVPTLSHGFSALIASDPNSVALRIPTQEPALSGLAPVLTAIIKATQATFMTGVADDAAFEALREACGALQTTMSQFPPNTGFLLSAAARRNIPTHYHIGQYYIFGQGRRHVLLNSSLPGHESCFGSATAKNKVMTNKLLRKLSFPVAKQAIPRSLEEARAKALEIGYPVVLKPADLDGGVGVFPFLQDERALDAAWRLCREKSENIILERHVQGNDYRLFVARGELIAAIERKPAQVTGDGQQSIAALLADENERRKPKNGEKSLFYPLPDDAEAEAILRTQGLTMQSVPARGQIARLRMAPNHAQGGMVTWCLDQVHPENARMACQIAEMMRLDVVGIDLICADIAEPWSNAEAAICEVNHQPSMGRPTAHDVFGRLLDKMLSDGATVPQIAVVGTSAAVEVTLRRLLDQLSGSARRIGSVRADGAYIGQERIAAGTSLFHRHRILVGHPGVDVILIGIEAPEQLQQGLASPSVDFIVPAESSALKIAQWLAKSYRGKIAQAQALHIS